MKSLQRGRPSKRSKMEIVLESKFLAAFAERGLGVNKTAVHFFGWAVANIENVTDMDRADMRLWRLDSDFEEFCKREGVKKSWRNAISWYVKKG